MDVSSDVIIARMSSDVILSFMVHGGERRQRRELRGGGRRLGVCARDRPRHHTAQAFGSELPVGTGYSGKG
eukprot:7241602-Prymnesium_polylepis.1